MIGNANRRRGRGDFRGGVWLNQDRAKRFRATSYRSKCYAQDEVERLQYDQERTRNKRGYNGTRIRCGATKAHEARCPELLQFDEVHGGRRRRE